jgi:hypothetical protein
VIWVLEQTMIEGMVCSFLYVVRFWKCYVDPTCEKTFQEQNVGILDQV